VGVLFSSDHAPAVQVVENKVHAYVSTHGPKLREISRQSARNSSPPTSTFARPAAPPTHTRISSAPSKAPFTSRNTTHSDAFHVRIASTPIHQARSPGQLLSPQGAAIAVSHTPSRPYTAGAAVQSALGKPAASARYNLMENNSPQRRARYAAPSAPSHCWQARVYN
jgi:hypothetical protein